jgi:ankyrin repeat protein
VSDKNEHFTFGHVLGGSRASGVAFIIAADQVVEDLREIREISQFLGKHNLAHLPDVEEQVKAARSHSHGRRLRLTEEYSEIDVHRRKYSEALHEAAVDGKTQIVKLLLDHGADVNARGGPYGSALHAASSKGHEQIVKLLLDKGANINARDGHYGSALQGASFEGHEQLVKLLLDKGTNINAQGGDYGSAHMQLNQ